MNTRAILAIVRKDLKVAVQNKGAMYFSLGVVMIVGLVIWLIDAVLLWFASKSFHRSELMTKF